jgi:protein required for attachment to host cells
MTTWILVGDEASARLFTANEFARRWRLRGEFSHPESRMKAEEVLTDHPNYQEPGTRHRDLEGLRFARALADHLERHHGEFTRLVLVGPPRFLGELRKQLPGPVQKKLTDSLARELVHVETRELEDRVMGALSG